MKKNMRKKKRKKKENDDFEAFDRVSCYLISAVINMLKLVL